MCCTKRKNFSIILESLGVEGEPGLVPTSAEDLKPLVEEEDHPSLKQAEAALPGRWAVAVGTGSDQDGPGEVVVDALVLQLPDMGA